MQRILAIEKNGFNLTKLQQKLTRKLNKSYLVVIKKNNAEQRLNVSIQKEHRYLFFDIYDIGNDFLLETRNEQDKYPFKRLLTDYDVFFTLVENMVSGGVRK